MAEALKVLGQVMPAAAASTDLYAVPAATQATVSSVSVCNQNSSPVKVRLSVAVGGAALAAAQYIFFDVVIAKNATLTATLGMTLGAADKVRCFSDTANVSFNLFGVEIS